MRKWQLRLCGLLIGAAGSLYGCAELIRYIHAWSVSYGSAAPFFVEVALVSLGAIWIIAMFFRTLPSCLPSKKAHGDRKTEAITQDRHRKTKVRIAWTKPSQKPIRPSLHRLTTKQPCSPQKYPFLNCSCLCMLRCPPPHYEVAD